MKKGKIKLIIIIGIIVFIGMFIIGAINYPAARETIKDDISNITNLTSTNIYSKINLELTKPIFVSLTMANDEFLKEWIQVDEEHNIDKIVGYLATIKQKYNYDSAFFVSNLTDNYYNFEGLFKQVSPADSHDVWYYSFLNTDSDYALDVDTDEAAENSMTVFVNCKITADDGTLLGVTGVGVNMSRVSQILKEYNEDMDLETFLIDGSGAVQIHSDESYIENYNVFDDERVAALMNEILGEKQQTQLFELKDSGTEEYLVTRYIEELDWYLIVLKDTSVLSTLFQKQIWSQIIVFLAVLAIIILVNSGIINYIKKRSSRIASIDALTELKNRRAFDSYLKEAVKLAKKKNELLSIVLFDIDDLKNINDTFGHIKGDEVIKQVAASAQKVAREGDMLARWGGDEFAIVCHCGKQGTQKLVDRIKAAHQENSLLAKHGITSSFGITQFIQTDDTQSVLERADNALYKAKKQCKNTIVTV